MAMDRQSEQMMDAHGLAALQAQAAQMIAGDEGRRLHVYSDTRGIPTIGIGCNLLTSVADIAYLGVNYAALLAGSISLSNSQVDALFARQLNHAIAAAQALVPSFSAHPTVVQAVLCDMVFQLGGAGVHEFHDMLIALNATPPNYAKAADEMLDSLWARQTPMRAKREADAMRGAA